MGLDILRKDSEKNNMMVVDGCNFEKG